MSRPLAVRIGFAYLAVTALLVGGWAAFAPRSFFVHFPGLGHTWTAVDGPYNEHLVRDVGDLNLALVVVTVCAAIWLARPLAVAAAAAWLVYSIPHLAYHAFNLDVISSGDRVPEIVGLVMPIVVAGVILALVVPADASALSPPNRR